MLADWLGARSSRLDRTSNDYLTLDHVPERMVGLSHHFNTTIFDASLQAQFKIESIILRHNKPCDTC